MAFCTALQEKVTGLATDVAPFAGAVSDGGVFAHCGVGTLTVVVTETLLFDDFGSAVFAETVAVSVMVPPAAGAAALIVIGVALPTGTDCAVQPMKFPWAAQVHPVPEALPKATPAGRVLVTTTFCAVVGPRLETLRT